MLRVLCVPHSTIILSVLRIMLCGSLILSVGYIYLQKTIDVRTQKWEGRLSMNRALRARYVQGLLCAGIRKMVFDGPAGVHKYTAEMVLLCGQVLLVYLRR